MNKSIAVIGQGFVGGSLKQVFMEHKTNVHTFDIKHATKQIIKNHDNKTEETKYTSLEELVRESEQEKTFSKIYFVCLPTPMYEDGSADISIVESVLDHLSQFQGNRIAVVKSTVPPGSTEQWNKKYQNTGLKVIFNPEFLTEANALNDMRNQTHIILGGPRPHINKVKQLFQNIFTNIPIIKTSSTTAEMVKYFINCFLATKVSFANEMYQLCEKLDEKGMNIDYDKVVEYAKFDKRIGTSHWSVPGPVATHTGEFDKGFGGHCFPKDINALMSIAKELKVDTKVLKGVWDKNLEVRKEKDWEFMHGRAVSKKPIHQYKKNMFEQAQWLFEQHLIDDQEIVKAFYSPCENEIRLLEVTNCLDDVVLPDVFPVGFQSRPDLGIDYNSTIILLSLPEWELVKKGELKLPNGWDYDKLICLYKNDIK
jgi:UDPglucose 6-dehydrogenase